VTALETFYEFVNVRLISNCVTVHGFKEHQEKINIKKLTFLGKTPPLRLKPIFKIHIDWA